MMQVLVDDLDGWWAHVMSIDLPKHLMSHHQSHPKCSLGGSGWPTSTIRQAYCGISLSADPATPPIKLGSSKIESPTVGFCSRGGLYFPLIHFTDVRIWPTADIASCTAHVRFWG
jgi:hypothetical protein